MASRRGFVATCAAMVVFGSNAVGQFAVGETSSVTRLDLAKIDRQRILAGAATALGRSPTPNSRAASDAFLEMTLDVPVLAAASQIDSDNVAKYGAKAAALLEAWFGIAGQKSSFQLEISGFEDLLGLSALAEVAVSLPFLPLPTEEISGAKAWFATYLKFLTTNREALLARDAKDRHGASWLLQVAAFARLAGDDLITEECRKRFRHATLRAEMNADGHFPGDLHTPDPFRNSLMHLDALAGVCVLLSTRFESMWDAELQDGTGMRAAVARHVPYMARPETWPYPADAEGFHVLPGRRPVLAFSARAYAQPEYAALFMKLAEPVDPKLLRAFPIRQPLLWASQPRHRE